MQGFLREEGHVFVDGVVGDVGVGGVVESNEDVEEDWGELAVDTGSLARLMLVGGNM